MSDVFFDTNIVVSLTSGDIRRSEPASQLIKEGGTVSVQILNEFASVARRKLKFSFDETRLFLADLRRFVFVVPLTLETHTAGLALAERYQLSIYDAMIVAAAQGAGCRTLYSEAMQSGMKFGKLRVVNPYR